MRRVAASLLLTSMLMAAPVVAQIQIRPTDAPIVTANNESWYINLEPRAIVPRECHGVERATAAGRLVTNGTAAADWCGQRVYAGEHARDIRHVNSFAGRDRRCAGVRAWKAESHNDSDDRAPYQQRWALDPISRREMDRRGAGGSGDA